MALESRRARIKEVRGYAPVACLSVTPKSSRSVLGTLHSLTGFGKKVRHGPAGAAKPEYDIETYFFFLIT